MNTPINLFLKEPSLIRIYTVCHSSTNFSNPNENCLMKKLFDQLKLLPGYNFGFAHGCAILNNSLYLFALVCAQCTGVDCTGSSAKTSYIYIVI